LVRRRHFNTIDRNEYGPNTNGDGLLSIGHQRGQRSIFGGSYVGAFYSKEIAIRVTGQNIGDKKHFASTGINVVPKARRAW
jgi:hypothetical protein